MVQRKEEWELRATLIAKIEAFTGPLLSVPYHLIDEVRIKK